MPGRKNDVTFGQVAATIREEFTTLNILVQALNRELRDIMITSQVELKNLARQMGARPVHVRASARMKPAGRTERA